jgi:hypothetical protein
MNSAQKPVKRAFLLSSLYSPKWVLQGKKIAAQKIKDQYLQNLAGDLAPVSVVL